MLHTLRHVTSVTLGAIRAIREPDRGHVLRHLRDATLAADATTGPLRIRTPVPSSAWAVHLLIHTTPHPAAGDITITIDRDALIWDGQAANVAAALRAATLAAFTARRAQLDGAAKLAVIAAIGAALTGAPRDVSAAVLDLG
jgi:hypothetical protein